MRSSQPAHRRRPGGRAAIVLASMIALLVAPAVLDHRNALDFGASAAPPSGGSAEEKPHVLQATLEVLRPFSYEGDPLMVRVAIFNTSDQPYENAAGINLLGGLKVASPSRGKLTPKAKTDLDPKKQPAVIPAGGFFGMIQDISTLIPDVSKADTYNISWEGAGVTADAVTVKVIPRFDPTAAYVAMIETDFGYLEFDLMTKEAPRHVQNFYDLASQGFYDNTIVHQVVKGVEARGGDPTGSGTGFPGYTLEPEITRELKHRRGTLSAVHLPGQKQDNGSQFVILLSPHEQYDGNLSIFGQLRKGDDVLQAIEAIPTTGQYDIPYYRPLKPIVLRSVVVRKAEAPKAG